MKFLKFFESVFVVGFSIDGFQNNASFVSVVKDSNLVRLELLVVLVNASVDFLAHWGLQVYYLLLDLSFHFFEILYDDSSLVDNVLVPLLLHFIVGLGCNGWVVKCKGRWLFWQALDWSVVD